MRPTEEQLKQIKSKQIELLQVFIEICDQLRLKYYLAYGTLLGAVRHGGFIPWDDDIDVCMPRNDYEIFVREAPNMLSKQFFLQTQNSDPEYLNTYAKLRDEMSTFIERTVETKKMHHGIYIDIFPLDYIPDNFLLAKYVLFKNKLIRYRVARAFDYQKHKMHFYKKVLIGCLYVINPTVKIALSKSRKMCLQLKKQKCFVDFDSCGFSTKNAQPCDWYGEGVYLMFEGIKARVPKEYEKCLEQMYGNYMQLPPVEERVSQHECTFIDTERSYTEYI